MSVFQIIPAVDLDATQGWFSLTADSTSSIAWGDMNGDGLLDLAVGNDSQPSKVYLNQAGRLVTTPAWSSSNADRTQSVAWGDMNGDGLLDLAVGNYLTPNVVYLNRGGTLSTTPAWSSPSVDATLSVAWGDMNGDGLLDLAVGNEYQQSQVYLNRGEELATTPAWSSPDADSTQSVAWGDMNGDGLLDLAVGNEYQQSKVYLNQGGMLATAPSWTSPDADYTGSVAWGDINSDGLLDLAVGNFSYVPSKVYLNQGGMLATIPAWFSSSTGSTSSVAWGDVNGDGLLDLALSKSSFPGVPSEIYLNQGGMLTTTPAWFSPSADSTTSIAWGDMNGDMLLDLAVGNGGERNKVYLNQGGMFATAPVWSSTSQNTNSVAWGDMNGDGLFDLAVSDDGVYLNQGEELATTPVWSSPDAFRTQSIAWGDMNGDGLLDLAVGNNNILSKVYLNQGGMLATTPAWSSPDADSTRSVAWGDMNGDGLLDLAVGNNNILSKVYLNQGGMLATTPAWSSPDADSTRSVAWGDMNGDGLLDLAIGNFWTERSKVYLNQGGMLSANPAWYSPDADHTTSVAWGDMNGDGLLDLAVGNQDQQSKVYLNQGGMLATTPAWYSPKVGNVQSVAWGDMNSDGLLDLAVGENGIVVYLNQGGALATSLAWSSPNAGYIGSVAWGDMNGDGLLDLAVQRSRGPGVDEVYLNHLNGHPLLASQRLTLAISHLSDHVIAAGGQSTQLLDPANFYAITSIRQSGQIQITYSIFHPYGETVRAVRTYYSFDGSFPADHTQWREAKAVYGTQPTDLSTSPFPTKTLENTHVFNWDVFGSGFFGESDNMVVRLEALPNLKSRPNSVPGPFLHPFISSQTFPFRVRGTQVRVLQAGNPPQPLNNANVYHLPANQDSNAQPFQDQRGVAFQTNSQGYLQGRGSLQVGDSLVALVPVTSTVSYIVYHTSATPVLTGLNAYRVNSLGVQTLTVSSANALILFNLSVSLEWDERNDSLFMQQLENDLQLASRFIYDLTNGQAALGDITIYHDRQHWREADIRVYATNQLRPHASIGGIVDGLEIDSAAPKLVNGVLVSDTLLYAPGQIEIGAIWNRYGEASDNLAEDWARTLAHELGHYLFFLNDNYLGLDGDRVISVEGCPGMMSNPYFDQQSEFHPQLNWSSECASTYSNQMLGRSDWATIIRHYPWLHAPTGAINNPPEAGPNALILAVTQIHVADTITTSNTLVEPTFFLSKADGNHYSPSNQAHALLFHEDRLIDLGAPRNDQVKAHGAHPGDELCIYDLAPNPSPLSQCKIVQQSGEQLRLTAQANWQPDVTITPVTSHTVAITVTGVSANALVVRLYPEDTLALPAVTLTYDSAQKLFFGTIALPKRVFAAHLHIYDPNDHNRGLVSNYTLGSGSDLFLEDGETLRMSSGRSLVLQDGTTIELSDGDVLEMSADGLTLRMSSGRTIMLKEGDALRFGDGQTLRMSSGRTLRMSSGRTHVLRQGDAPIISSDGEMTIFGDQAAVAPGEYYILQPATLLPAPPTWATVIGKAYKLTASPGARDLGGAPISFNYLGRDINPDKEKLLRIYLWDGTHWQSLATTIDEQHNIAYASASGLGIYVLMYSIDIPLAGHGWNQFGYSIPDTKPITDGLASINGSYNLVYSYDAFAADVFHRWKVYAVPPTPAWVNTLGELAYNHAYWINITATHGITLQLADVTASQVNVPSPPALYYGTVQAGKSFTPTAAMQVQAWIGTNLCGKSTTTEESGQIVYSVAVVAAGSEDATECGSPGQAITFSIDSTTMSTQATWDNSQPWNVSLSPTEMSPIYLPLINR